MAALLRRLPSFRRSVSLNNTSELQKHNTDSSSNVDGPQPEITEKTIWTVEEAAECIATLNIDALRTVLSDLSERNSEVRSALQKHAKNQPIRPDPAGHSMSKKRRAEQQLDKSASTSFASNIENDSTTTLAEASFTASPAAVPTQGDKLVVEGQTGLVVLPAAEPSQAAEGVEEQEEAPHSDSEGASLGPPSGSVNKAEKGKAGKSEGGKRESTD